MTQTASPTTPNPIEASYRHEDWLRGYESQPQEFDYWIEDIMGELPPELQGTFFRNGPGLLEVNGQPLHHPFDGDGMVSAISFAGDRVHYRNRYVRTAGFCQEQAAGRILYRGVFGTRKPGGWLANAFDLRFKNIANTHVIYWGGKLLALWEGGEPHRLDPATLETWGLETFDGQLKPPVFAAHPHLDPASEADGGQPCLVNFAVASGLSTTLKLYELDPSARIVRQTTYPISGFAFMHDFAITPHYGIFFQTPTTLQGLPYVLGLRSPGECIRFHPDRPTRVILLPRPGAMPAAAKPIVLETDPCFVFHHANAFEMGDEICVDSICYATFPTLKPGTDFRRVDFRALPPGELWRFHLNLKTGKVTHEVLLTRCCEFPSLHPAHVGRPYRYLYLGAAPAPMGNAPLQAFLKLDLQTGEQQLWSAAPKGFTGEPLFVPRPGSTAEDEGWVLAIAYDSCHHRSDVLIFAAQDLGQGPIARLHLRHHIPFGLHGSFTPEVFIR
ncbi:carotenoid oxygenase family protein [Trichothermofontia sp.]